MNNPMWYRKAGDIGDSLVVEVDGVDTDNDGTDDLLGVIAVTGKVQYADGPPAPLTAVVTDPTAKLVTVQLSPWLDGVPAGRRLCWKFTLDVTFNGGVGPITWPEQGFAEIITE